MSLWVKYGYSLNILFPSSRCYTHLIFSNCKFGSWSFQLWDKNNFVNRKLSLFYMWGICLHCAAAVLVLVFVDWIMNRSILFQHFWVQWWGVLLKRGTQNEMERNGKCNIKFIALKGYRLDRKDLLCKSYVHI